MKNIILFASGNGTNVKNIIQYYKGSSVNIPLIVTNNNEAGVIDIAKENKIPILLVNKTVFESEIVLDNIEKYKPDLLVLAGFLWKIPSFMLNEFPNKIINIHPSLLPAYGGKGMYGHYVHQAVLNNNEQESGITIHVVNAEYDKGTILLQKKVSITSEDDETSLAKKIQELEHAWYPKVIDQLLN